MFDHLVLSSPLPEAEANGQACTDRYERQVVFSANGASIENFP